MGTIVYVDILLVVNYVINVLLILCTIKFSGISPKRRKIVAAALFGSLCSLTIFLPFLGFFPELMMKILVSAAVVRIAMPWSSGNAFLKQWFVFFAVNFFFAGVMMALWMAFAPRWLTYYNGVVYFDVSPFTLLGGTAVAYLVITVVDRLARGSRVEAHICRVQIYLGEKVCAVNGLMDTGNSLTEPFSGAPVVVCSLQDIRSLLPEQVVAAVEQGATAPMGPDGLELPLRMVPYHGVGGMGILPAFAPDKLVIRNGEESSTVEAVYVAVSKQPIGDSRYSAILNPNMIRVAGTARKEAKV